MTDISQIKNYTSDIASEKAVRNSGTSKTIDDHKNDLSTKESNEMVSDYLSDTKNTSLEEITFTVDSHLKDQNNFIEEKSYTQSFRAKTVHKYEITQP